MIGPRWALAIAALTLTAACGRGERPRAGADSTRATAPADSGAAPSSYSARLEGFEAPESAKYDAELDVWYISNVNGSPGAKDNVPLDAV